MLASTQLRIGDAVSWIEPSGIVTGRVVRRITASEWLGAAGGLGSRVRASEEHPCVLVEPDLGPGPIPLRPERLSRI
jgi:hypothetical protein